MYWRGLVFVVGLVPSSPTYGDTGLASLFRSMCLLPDYVASLKSVPPPIMGLTSRPSGTFDEPGSNAKHWGFMDADDNIYLIDMAYTRINRAVSTVSCSLVAPAPREGDVIESVFRELDVIVTFRPAQSEEAMTEGSYFSEGQQWEVFGKHLSQIETVQLMAFRILLDR